MLQWALLLDYSIILLFFISFYFHFIIFCLFISYVCIYIHIHIYILFIVFQSVYSKSVYRGLKAFLKFYLLVLVIFGFILLL